jgi:predicted lipoprotein
MKRKHLLYLIGLAALVLVLGSSLEFRRLDDKRAEERASRFSPAEYARDFWDNRLQTALGNPQAADEMIRLFNTDMKAAIAHGRTLGHSRVHAYLLQGAGRIAAARKDGLLVSVLPEDPGPEVLLCTGSYISGNAVRDASGLVDVSAFPDTMKFNRISAEINRIVVQEVIAPFLERAPQVGMSVRFLGAAEVAEEATEKIPFGSRERRGESEGPWHLLRVVPIQLEMTGDLGIRSSKSEIRNKPE